MVLPLSVSDRVYLVEMGTFPISWETGTDLGPTPGSIGRPDFPRQLQGWLRDDLELGPGRSAIDLGAGTGKFTRLLLETGAKVTAIEPVAAMRERLIRDLPGVTALRGTARHISLPDSCARWLSSRTCAIGRGT